MQKKIILTGLSALLLSLNTSCSGGGGAGGPTVASTPVPVLATPVPTSVPLPITNNPAPVNKFDQPLTDVPRPNPLQQFNSYLKIMKALDLGDYDYAYREYEAGNLKLSAIKGENQFGGDYTISSSIISLFQNLGFIGLNNRNLSYNLVTPQERRLGLNAFFKQILIYSSRDTLGILYEFNKSGLSPKDDKYSINVANDAATYFYGTETSEVADGSIAQMAQTIDKENALKEKTFDTISAALAQVKALSKTDNTTALVNAKNQADMAYQKMLYMLTFQRIADAVTSKSGLDLADAEFNYIGIRKDSQSKNNIKSTRVETILSNKNLAELNYGEIEKTINTGFQEKAVLNMNNAVANITSNNNAAQNSALLAQLYVDITNCAYENRKFIRNPNVNLAANMQTFVDAIKAKNTVQAQQSIATLEKYISTGT